MKDQDIVNLYWDRNESAIHQTEMKYAEFDILIPRDDIRAIVICGTTYQLNSTD